MSNEPNNEKGLKNGKCIDCGACGNAGCCSPVDCKMTFNCEYCKDYLNELRFSYESYHKLYNLIYKYESKCPELFADADEIVEELREKYGY
jgi:predicted molibdopterin-dependent oxidoreductase YjgC